MMPGPPQVLISNGHLAVLSPRLWLAFKMDSPDFKSKFYLFFFFNVFYVRGCFAQHECLLPTETRKGTQVRWLRVITGCWECNPGPMQRQDVSETSLQPPSFCSEFRFFFAGGVEKVPSSLRRAAMGLP